MTRALIENALLLSSLCWLLTFSNSLWCETTWNRGKLLAGLWFGVACVVGMSRPLALEAGLIFDARSLVLSLAGLFGGPLVGGIAALIAGGYRLWLGGAGIHLWITSILLPLLLGLAYRHAWQRGRLRIGFWPLLAFGLLLHLLLFAVQWLAGALGRQALEEVAIALVLVFPPLLAILGLLLDDMRQRALTLHALHLSEARQRAIKQAIPDLLAVLDPDGRLIEFSSGDPRIAADTLEGRHLHELLGPEESARILAHLQQAAETPDSPLLEYRLRDARGERIYEGRARRLEQQIDGRPALLWIGREVTERRALEQERRIAAIAFESQQGMFITDARTRILRVNQAFCRITGYSSAEVLGQPASILASGRQSPAFYDQMWHGIEEHGSWEGEIWNRRRNGEVFPEWLTISAVRDDQQKVTHYVAALSDITERNAAQERIHNLAFFDPLTGLPNRRLLLDRLQQAVHSASRQHYCSALMFLDLDGFKSINDLHGHQTGDLLLQAAAQRLLAQVRASDTVARLGGDEFVVLLENLATQPEQAAAAARQLGMKMLTSLGSPYAIDTLQLHSSASIGVVLFSDDSASLDELLTRADLSMYEAKRAGKNALRFFDAGLQQVSDDRLRLEQEIAEGLRRNEFVVHVQPLVDEDRGLIGAEALLRWQHPRRGLLEPGAFLDAARRARLLQRLDLKVLEAACQLLQDWSQQPHMAELSLSVNLSAASLYRDDFVAGLLQLLERYCTPATRLWLELTETLLLDDIASACERMEQLRARGVQFSIDDFGTGYSSIAQLQRLPLAQLKIDQSFIEQLAGNNGSQAVVQSIGALAQSLQLKVLAEGVETETQHQLLLGKGCRRFQGHLFGRPMAPEAFAQHCREHQARD